MEAVYLFPPIVCAAILAALDRLPLVSDLGVAVKRTVLAAFPARFGATAMDSPSGRPVRTSPVPRISSVAAYDG